MVQVTGKIFITKEPLSNVFFQVIRTTQLKNVRIKGKKKVMSHILLSTIGLIAAKISIVKVNNQQQKQAA
jgi:hypothetical protein